MENRAAVTLGVIGGTFGGIIGGAIGGAAAGFISGSGISGTQYLKLDLNTGMFDVFLRPEDKMIRSYLTFYSSDKNGQPFELLVNDKPVCRLVPGTWCKESFPSTSKSLNVKIVSADGKMFENTVIPRLFQNDVYICYERKKKPPFFRKLSADAAESIKQKLTADNQAGQSH